MKTRHFLAVCSLVFLIISCQKEDLSTKESEGSGTDIVFNVNKPTILQLVNNVRQSGCTCGTTVMPPVAPITWNDQLAKAAYDHSRDMYLNNYFSHTSLNGRTAGQRITAAGYQWRSIGENIARGYASEQSVMTGWLNSEGHCRNIMGAGFREMGVGREGNYWTQEFGSR